MMSKLKAKSAKRKIKVQSLKFLVFSFGFTLFALCFTFSVVCAQPISSTEIINNAKQHDGQYVVFEGEVIGEVMARGNYAWINLHDGTNAIGVWIAKNLTDVIKYTGNYQFKGDWVEISGVFNRACAEHGGDLDIHAQTINKTLSGRAVKRKVNINKINLVFILLGVLVIIWILKLLQRR